MTLPVCATGLILDDDGTTPPRCDAASRGWSDTWTSDHRMEGEQ